MDNFEEKINEVRNKNNIVDVISENVQLTKKGKNYFGLCPFHNDSNPSMSVSPEKQIYRCFSCGASGNVFSFLMNYENINFNEALQRLADRVGIEIGNNFRAKGSEAVVIHKELYDIYDVANKYFKHNLFNSSSGNEALKYLQNRKFDDEVLKDFEIGYAKDSRDELKNLLVKKKYAEQLLSSVGIINKNDYGYQNTFIERIIFPIWDDKGKVIAFSGRKFRGEDNLPKYINTKETKLFRKGTVLYNYHRAKEWIRRQDEVIIMEGFFDVIRAYSVDIKNVIATMGTALTKDQLVTIRRLTSNVILCFDGDAAGLKSMYNFADDLEQFGFNVHITVLKGNLDPDEFIIKNGTEAFKNQLKNAYSPIDFRLKYLKIGKNLNDDNEKTEYLNSVLKIIAGLRDDIKIELYLNKLHDEFNISLAVLKDKVKKLSDNNKKADTKSITREQQPKYEDKYFKASKLLLANMIRDKRAVHLYKKNVCYLPSSNHRYLANEIIQYYQYNDKIELADFITFLKDKKDLIKLLGEIDSLELINPDYNEKILDDYINTIKEYNSNIVIKQLESKMRDVNDPYEKAKLAEKIREIKMMGCNINGKTN